MPLLRPLLSSAMEFLLRKRNDLKDSSFARSGGDNHRCRRSASTAATTHPLEQGPAISKTSTSPWCSATSSIKKTSAPALFSSVPMLFSHYIPPSFISWFTADCLLIHCDLIRLYVDRPAHGDVAAKDRRKVAKKRQIYEMEPELILLIKDDKRGIEKQIGEEAEYL